MQTRQCCHFHLPIDINGFNRAARSTCLQSPKLLASLQYANTFTEWDAVELQVLPGNSSKNLISPVHSLLLYILKVALVHLLPVVSARRHQGKRIHHGVADYSISVTPKRPASAWQEHTTCWINLVSVIFQRAVQHMV